METWLGLILPIPCQGHKAVELPSAETLTLIPHLSNASSISCCHVNWDWVMSTRFCFSSCNASGDPLRETDCRRDNSCLSCVVSRPFVWSLICNEVICKYLSQLFPRENQFLGVCAVFVCVVNLPSILRNAVLGISMPCRLFSLDCSSVSADLSAPLSVVAFRSERQSSSSGCPSAARQASRHPGTWLPEWKTPPVPLDS